MNDLYLDAMESMAKGIQKSDGDPYSSIDKSVAISFAEQIVNLVVEVRRLKKLIAADPPVEGSGYGYETMRTTYGSTAWSARHNGNTFATGISTSSARAREAAWNAIAQNKRQREVLERQCDRLRGGCL